MFEGKGEEEKNAPDECIHAIFMLRCNVEEEKRASSRRKPMVVSSYLFCHFHGNG
jgi:hypothetical protein